MIFNSTFLPSFRFPLLTPIPTAFQRPFPAAHGTILLSTDLSWLYILCELDKTSLINFTPTLLTFQGLEFSLLYLRYFSTILRLADNDIINTLLSTCLR